jgi:hypothetical protein
MRAGAMKEITPLIDLAIHRSRARTVADPELKRLILGALGAARQELVHLKDVTKVEDRADEYRKIVREPVGWYRRAGRS